MTLLRRFTGIPDAVAVITSVFFFTAAFARFGQNDFMYATAPIFWSTLPLYKDLAFVQAPGSILVYGSIYNLVEPQNFFLVLRIFSLAVLMAASFFVYLAARVLFGRVPAAIALIFLFTSHFVASAALDSGSVTLALFFLCMALFVYLSGPINIRAALIIGVSVGIAASMKLNFALYSIPFGVFIAYRAGLRSRELLTYIAGGLVGSSAIWYYAIVDFESFWFFNVRYHMLMNEHRATNGLNLEATLGAAAVLFLLYMSPLIYFLVKILQNGVSLAERQLVLELAILFAVTLLAAFAPMYYAPQYMAPPVVILSLFVALIAKMLLPASRPISRSLYRGTIVVSLGWVAVFWFSEFPASLKTFEWNPVPAIQMQRMRNRIDDLAVTSLDGSPCKRTAISLSPIPLIGSSFEISPINATGQFLPMVTPEIMQHAPRFSRFGLTTGKLDTDRITAFLVGFFPDTRAEGLIMAYARNQEFVAFDVGTLPGMKNVRPDRQIQLLLRRACITRKASSH